MNTAIFAGVALGLASLAAPIAATSAVPAAIAADPAPDAVLPAGMAALQIPSADGVMNAVLYTPSGPGPHPALILFHGQPGNEQNLDLAQAVRRAGYAVLTLHYRGSWGSPGTFSYANATADGINSVDWLMAPEQMARFRIDKDRLVLAGHSVGGFVAMRAAAARPAVKALMLIDAWHVDETSLSRLRAPNGREAYVAAQGNSLNMLATTPTRLVDEILDAGTGFDLRGQAPALATRPVLVIAAEKGNGSHNHSIASSLRASGNKQVEFVLMPTDHGFNDHRIALISTSLGWLDQLTRRP